MPQTRGDISDMSLKRYDHLQHYHFGCLGTDPESEMQPS